MIFILIISTDQYNNSIASRQGDRVIFAEFNMRRLGSDNTLDSQERNAWGFRYKYIYESGKGEKERETEYTIKGWTAGMVPERFGRYRAPFVLREAEYP